MHKNEGKKMGGFTMSKQNEEVTNEIQVDSEYSRCAVPKDQRKSYWSLTIVWTGFVFAIISMMAGGGLAVGFSFKQILIAAVIGNVFLCIIAVAVSIVACRTGLTFALLTRYSFGSSGSKVASLFVPIVNIGWYTIQSATFGHFIAQIFNFGDVGEAICMIISAAAMGIFAFYGIKAITILGYVAIPAIIFLSVATSIRSLGVVGGVQALLDYRPSAPITFAAGVTIVIGAWILSTATCIADIMRYAKSTKSAIGAALTGLLGGNILMIVSGAIATISVNDSDLTSVLLKFGLVIPSLILMTTNIFTTNASNLYSTSLNLSNSFKMDRTKMMLILIGVSSLATLTRPYQMDFFIGFLNTLGNIVPPLAGIILADYFIVHKGKYSAYENTKFVKWNPIPWITWGISVAIVYAFIYVLPFGMPSINGIIAGMAIYSVLMLASAKEVVTERWEAKSDS